MGGLIFERDTPMPRRSQFEVLQIRRLPEFLSLLPSSAFMALPLHSGLIYFRVVQAGPTTQPVFHAIGAQKRGSEQCRPTGLGSRIGFSREHACWSRAHACHPLRWSGLA